MTSPTSITPDVVGILADVARRGITLQAHDGKVRFRPRSAMTPDLAQRIKAHRSALLALLSDTTPPEAALTGPVDRESGVSSVVSVSEAPEARRHSQGPWSKDELKIVAQAGTTPADLPLVSAVKGAFGDGSCGRVTVVSASSARGQGSWPRCRAAQLIRDARLSSTAKAVAMRDAWRERLAVCTIDGGLADDDAEHIALTELEDQPLF